MKQERVNHKKKKKRRSRRKRKDNENKYDNIYLCIYNLFKNVVIR